jgi:hypothetical protein
MWQIAAMGQEQMDSVSACGTDYSASMRECSLMVIGTECQPSPITDRDSSAMPAEPWMCHN